MSDCLTNHDLSPVPSDDRVSHALIRLVKVIESTPLPDLIEESDDGKKVITVIIPVYDTELTFILSHNQDNLLLIDGLVHRLLADSKLLYQSSTTTFNKNSALVSFEQEKYHE